MSGTVISEPRREHHCAPGWEWRESDGTGLLAIPAGRRYGIPPTPWQFPRGTIWRCDACGRHWVSEGSRYINVPGECHFRPERWLERRRRERHDRARSRTAPDPEDP